MLFLDVPAELTTAAEVVELYEGHPGLVGWANTRDRSPDPVVEAELRRLFGMPALAGRGVFFSSAEPFPARIRPAVTLPALSAPAEGWARSTPADTARAAAQALTAAARASVARAVAADPAAQASAARAARDEAEAMTAYAEQAAGFISASSSPWLARIREHQRDYPAVGAIPIPTDKRPIAAYRETPVNL